MYSGIYFFTLRFTLCRELPLGIECTYVYIERRFYFYIFYSMNICKYMYNVQQAFVGIHAYIIYVYNSVFKFFLNVKVRIFREDIYISYKEVGYRIKFGFFYQRNIMFRVYSTLISCVSSRQKIKVARFTLEFWRVIYLIYVYVIYLSILLLKKYMLIVLYHKKKSQFLPRNCINMLYKYII